MKKEMLTQKLAQKMERAAIDIAKNSVGKSMPYTIHEVKLPKELREMDLKEL